MIKTKIKLEKFRLLFQKIVQNAQKIDIPIARTGGHIILAGFGIAKILKK